MLSDSGKVGKRLYYSERLVQRVNELYHDLTATEYESAPPETIEEEKGRWERVAKKFFDTEKPLTVVDIGTGTGFVPLAIAHLLKKGDTFICTDISQKMLEAASTRIAKKNLPCDFKFVKIESQVPLRLPLETSSADAVTLNSVLHHIKDTRVFLREIDRILKTSGLLLISREPNRYFREHKFLWNNYQFLKYLTLSKDTVYEITVRTHTKKILRFLYSRYKKDNIFVRDDKVTELINSILLQEKLVDAPLDTDEIVKITDIKASEGFRPDRICPTYELVYEETYNHLSSVEAAYSNSRIVKKYSRWLRKIFPKYGYSFFVVLRKPKTFGS